MNPVPDVNHYGRVPLVAAAATIAAVLGGVGSIIADGEVEVSLLMVVAVIAGLACFDAAMDRKRGPFWSWALLSMAPIAKTVPTVIYELRADSGALFQRYDHAGSVLAGLCVFAAVLLLVKPATALGNAVAVFDLAVVAGAALVAGLAGTSVAFLYDRGFGTLAAARLLETSAWTIIGATLAATAIAASHTRRIAAAFAGVLVFANAVAGLLAIGLVGPDPDRGWWALAFAALAANATLNRRRLGTRSERNRRSNVAVVVAIVAGLIAAAAAISARSDPQSWGPGWALLGVVSLLMFLLAMASRPLDEQVQARTESVPAQGGVVDLSRPVAPDPREPVPKSGVAPVVAGVQRLGRARSSSAAELQGLPEDSATYPQGPPVDELLSDAGIVASARDAAAVRNAPHPRRHSLAPVDQAHHFDPSTGLLSAAGLQHAVARAFDVERRAGHVTILVFMIRNLDRIEHEHGRLASAAVTRAVADRVRFELGDGTGARFARSAFAVIFVGDRSDSAVTTQAMAQALQRLRMPVVDGPRRLEIDVVAGMAQCYDRENAAQFVQRANRGLARAVQSSEPSLVAMP